LNAQPFSTFKSSPLFFGSANLWISKFLKKPWLTRGGSETPPLGLAKNICSPVERLFVFFVSRLAVLLAEARKGGWEGSMTAMILSGLGGAALIALGSDMVFPLGSAVGGVCELAGIASAMVFFGLMDGK
jgi:hypothetical protein